MLLPSPVRKLVAVFRGQVSPVFVFLAACIGFSFGLLPGWSGLHVALLVLALVLNVHAGSFILFAGLGKAICLAGAPVLYHAGRAAQSGLDWLFGGLGAIPIIGLTDFDRCAVAGATILGPVIGVLGGLMLMRAVVSFRKQWLKLEEKSEKFAQWQKKSWVRWLDWFLLGKRADDAKKALDARGGIIRPAGVVVAVLLVAVSAAGMYFAGGDQLRGVVQDRLTLANGAEVSIASFDLNAFGGRLSASGIAATDPQKPTHDRVRVDEFVADVGLWPMLTGRIVIDRVALSGVATDVERESAGVVIPAEQPKEAPAQRDAFDPARFALAVKDVAKLSDYYRQGEGVSEKIEQVAKWLPESKPSPPKPKPPQHYLEYLTARGPVTPRPRVIVREVTLTNVATGMEEIGQADITLRNVTDAPYAARLPVEIRIVSRERPGELTITCRYDRASGGADIDGTIGDVQLDRLQTRLNPDNPIRFEGGTASAVISGEATRESMDLRLAVETQGMRASTTDGGLFGLDPRASQQALSAMENMHATLRIVGPTSAPRLGFDSEEMAEAMKVALVESGKAELSKQLDKAIGDKLPEEASKAGEIGKGALEGLGGLLGGKKDDDNAP